METDGLFYLGRIVDSQSGETSDQPLVYDPEDLTTHAVVVGMTGSGKTGLCIDLLEEAALKGVPALLIDPKGDITNHLLHFPDLAPQDFQPWINADQARRDGVTVDEAARQAADTWRKGLSEWGIGPERLQALKNAAGYTVYTPGSSSGVPVSVLASFQRPNLDWEPNRELLREKISGTVTALLGLVGLDDIDPVRSREHILLSNIFEHAWGQGMDMDLGELILQTQNPPFSRLGVFDVNIFFPEKDRFELAMLLNNILASPAFQSWIEGDPLDVQSLLYLPDGRPRHNVFYIAHLSDAERMFFVTLLYSAVESWMRAQSGTNSLRMLLYFDEIFGYLPPIGNPPSKEPMLRMLKQARAFGVGQVLVTQNPVDVDYKALSNAGTWFIGKLQTDQDKERLLDGLASAGDGGLDRRAYDTLISSLGKRVFLLHNIHGKAPVLFGTRWAMNYLAGPLTRSQIPALNALAGGVRSAKTASQPALPVDPEPASRSVPASDTPPLDRYQAVPAVVDVSVLDPEPAATEWGTTTRPAVPSGVAEYFLPNNLTISQVAKAAGREIPPDASSAGLLYRPAVLVQVHVRYTDRKSGVDHGEFETALVQQPDQRGMIRWEEFLTATVDPRSLDRGPAPDARFTALELPLSDGRIVKSLERDFQDWIYRTARLPIQANEALKVYAGPDVSPAEFRQMCAEEARKKRDIEVEKVVGSYEKKLDRLEDRLERELRELDSDETELSQRRMEEMGTHAENVLSLFSRRRKRISTSLTKRRMTAKAQADVKESKETIRSLEREIAALELEAQQAVDAVNDEWGEVVSQDSEISISPYKKNILTDLFGVAWVPFHVVRAGGNWIELPGFSSGD